MIIFFKIENNLLQGSLLIHGIMLPKGISIIVYIPEHRFGDHMASCSNSSPLPPCSSGAQTVGKSKLLSKKEVFLAGFYKQCTKL
jgi:hypothetical protein